MGLGLVSKKTRFDHGLHPKLPPLEGELVSLEAFALAYVYQVLLTLGWNRTHTAAALEISIRTLRNYVRKLRALGVEVPDSFGRPTEQ